MAPHCSLQPHHAPTTAEQHFYSPQSHKKVGTLVSSEVVTKQKWMMMMFAAGGVSSAPAPAAAELHDHVGRGHADVRHHGAEAKPGHGGRRG